MIGVVVLGLAAGALVGFGFVTDDPAFLLGGTVLFLFDLWVAHIPMYGRVRSASDELRRGTG